MAHGDGFDILGMDDLEEMEGSGNCTWRLARRSLGISSFGLNVVEIPPGGALPEHDETGRDQEELFIVLAGEAVAIIHGEEHTAPAGTFVRLSPEPRRAFRNDADAPARLLIVSAPRESGYEPMRWA